MVESPSETKSEVETKPEVKPVKVKSAAEYLKEFSEFYNEEVEIKVEVKEEAKHKGTFEEQEEIEEVEFEEEELEEEEFEENEFEGKEFEEKEFEEEEFEKEESARQAAPRVRPAVAPPDSLELCKDLDNAGYDAEQRIGKLEGKNKVNESWIADLEEHIGKLKEAAETRFKEQEERLATHVQAAHRCPRHHLHPAEGATMLALNTDLAASHPTALTALTATLAPSNQTSQVP